MNFASRSPLQPQPLVSIYISSYDGGWLYAALAVDGCHTRPRRSYIFRSEGTFANSGASFFFSHFFSRIFLSMSSAINSRSVSAGERKQAAWQQHRLSKVVFDEAKRRGRLQPSFGVDVTPSSRPTTDLVTKRTPRTADQRKVDMGEITLTPGQVNAVRSAFKAGITPSRIARQFGLSQSGVRKALASDESKR